MTVLVLGLLLRKKVKQKEQDENARKIKEHIAFEKSAQSN